jgi:hypothetical protein
MSYNSRLSCTNYQTATESLVKAIHSQNVAEFFSVAFCIAKILRDL